MHHNANQERLRHKRRIKSVALKNASQSRVLRSRMYHAKGDPTGTPKDEGESRDVQILASTRSTYVRANFMMEDRRHCKCDISWEEHVFTHDRHQVEHGNATFAAYVGKLQSERYVILHACVPSSRSQRVGIEATSEVECREDERRRR